MTTAHVKIFTCPVRHHGPLTCPAIVGEGFTGPCSCGEIVPKRGVSDLKRVSNNVLQVPDELSSNQSARKT